MLKKDDIEQYKVIYFDNDEPVTYHLNEYDIKISPILVKDAPTYNFAKQILLLDKNSTNDIEIIQMNYLDFLLTRKLKEDQCLYMFYYIMDKCLNEPYFMPYDINGQPFKKNGRNVLALCDEHGNAKGYITHKQFEDISKIILFQNDINYDDRTLSTDVQKVVEDYYRIKNKDIHIPSLGEQKVYVMSRTGFSMKDINEMTLRTFEGVYDNCLNSEIYLGEKIIQGSYKYDVKEDVLHPLYRKRKDPIEEAFASYESVENKINNT